MAGRASVKAYTRKGADGKSVKVTRHTKGTRPGSGRQKKTAARRGWNNLKQAYKYGRRKKRLAATAFAVLGTAQIGSFVALRGITLAAASVALIASAVAAVAYAASSGGRLPE
ncbi:hypothetical protein [Kribbella ginsengisoli]|uniref:Uncharacterized protein n=1 Tax=Kribbella ginsengisoli TaxID=363865 RepID=A0ABP6Z976_9ACTN